MKITRIANAGVLVWLDGISVSLDGVCNEFPPYLGTPEDIRRELVKNPPDIFAVTHFHPDHSDDEFFSGFARENCRILLAPGYERTGSAGTVTVSAVETRHIGKSDIPHASYVINGSRRVWFMGDASPLSLKAFADYPAPHVIIAPYAYANTSLSYKNTKNIGADKIVILHLPEEDKDEYGIISAVKECTAGDPLFIFPKINETITID